MTTSVRSESFLLSTLPGRYYYEPTLYQREQERIFSQMWVCVGRADALSTVGAYQLANVGRESVVIVRDRDAVLHGQKAR